MNDIIRKQMKDVIVPQNDIVRRPVIVPETTPAPKERSSGGSRIESNPFFEKPRPKKVERPISGDTGSDARSGSGVKGILWALLFTMLLALGFVVANFFATATVEIVPITRPATIDATITVPKEAVEGELVFNTATLTEEKTKEVPATIEKKVQVKASGKVVIFNAYSSAPQSLVINTRLESPEHKIFRINKSVVVPGMKVVGGKNVPGSVEVTVYSDVASKDYNIGTTNFTIPGFKGDPRYSKITAASKADSPISGGFSGVVKVPSDESIIAAREELKQDLKKITAEKVRTQIPDGSSFFPGSMVIKFEEVPQEFSEADTSNVSVRATASVFFFDTELLTRKLAEVALPEDKDKSLSIPEMSALTFAFVDSVDSIILSDLTKLKFHIGGEATFVGKIDSDKIRTALVGKEKKDFATMITSETNVYKADAVIRPMWKTMFPVDASKITVKILTK